MNTKKWLFLFILIAGFALFLTGCEKKLPGASGDASLIIGQESDKIQIKDAFVLLPTSQGRPYPPRFPSGSKEIDLVVAFRYLYEGAKVDARVINDSGEVKMLNEKDMWGLMDSGDPNAPIIVGFLKPLNGKFADGAYQAIVTIDGVDFIQVNWTVGEKP
jgi:hypothetical protein